MGDAPVRLVRVDSSDQQRVAGAVASVRCPYANGRRVMAWRTASPRDERAQRSLEDALQEALQAGMEEVVVLLAPASASADGLRSAVAELLRTTAMTAPAQWWYRTGGSDWFITVHSPHHPAEHSRSWPLAEPAVVFVPRRSFHRLFPDGVPEQARESVRAAFAAAGQRYPARCSALASDATESRTLLRE